jgi:NAD(P)-dependent dehydrogenase (short-subunit alcohol dehydrogenase family)
VTSRRVLVVGASSGVGRAVTELLLGREDRVVAAARRIALLEEIVAGHDGASAQSLDLRDAEQCDNAVSSAVERLGGLDAVVIAAGVIELDDLAEMDSGRWWSLLATNLVGPALVARAAAPALEAAGGRAVFVSSIAARRPLPGAVPYGVSKAALEALAAGFQEEHPAIGVSCLALGPVLTGMADGLGPELLRRRVRHWREAYGFPNGAMTAGEVAHVVVGLLDTPVRVPYAVAVPPWATAGPSGLSGAPPATP